jgi:hypothetical protein
MSVRRATALCLVCLFLLLIPTFVPGQTFYDGEFNPQDWDIP